MFLPPPSMIGSVLLPDQTKNWLLSVRSLGEIINVVYYNTTVVPDGDTELTVERGSSVTLKVKATSPNNHFSFVWRTGLINNPPTESTDETSDSITISNVQEDRVYYCYALNDYNEVYTVIFRVKVSDNNRIVADIKEQS